MKKVLFFILLMIAFLATPRAIFAAEVLGIHVLHPYEIDDAQTLLKTEKNKDEWMYITIPFGVNDVDKLDVWQSFFNKCREKKFIPIIRLITVPEGDAWRIPTKKDIVSMSRALSSLSWPSDERLVIIFNEPNQRHEWANTINPVEYAEILLFASDWFHTEPHGYTVLPAGLDLAAPNGETTMEAFQFWKIALKEYPDLFEYIDGWNSHSYPNPGFSSAPTLTTKSSLRGYQHELTFLAQHTPKQFGVYITETGWNQSTLTRRTLTNYYQYAQKFIWNDPRIKAVTPFVLRGSPGPFEDFSFFDEAGSKTFQFEAYRNIVELGTQKL